MNLFSSHGKVALRLPTDGPSAFQATSASDEKVLHTLAHVGFLRSVDVDSAKQAWSWGGNDPVADRALLALLARFDLHLEVDLAADETVWIAAAMQEQTDDSARRAFSGTGFRPDEAIRTCLGEFAEFQSWLYRPSDGDRHCDRLALGERTIDPWDILGFSAAQPDRRLDFNANWAGYDLIPDPSAFDGEIDWTAVESLADRSTHWLPAQICFGKYGERVTCADPSWRVDSNGCAAGRTQQHATAHALLELVERDATGIWWYGRIPRPAVPRSLMEDDPISAALADRERLRQSVSLLDLTHDLEIPVVAAILADSDGCLLSLGFGCDVDRVQAARSAYREMCQMELALDFARRRVTRDGDAATSDDRRLLAWLEKAGDLPHLRPAEGLIARRLPTVARDDAQIVEHVLERLRRAGLAAYSRDLQRPEIGVPAVRAFVPGLCHFKPRLGFRRLIEVPRALRWCEADFGADDLSDLPLLI